MTKDLVHSGDSNHEKYRVTLLIARAIARSLFHSKMSDICISIAHINFKYSFRIFVASIANLHCKFSLQMYIANVHSKCQVLSEVPFPT